MFEEIIKLIIVTLLPFSELRASIPYGILGLGMNWMIVFFICVIFNIILGIGIYFLLDKFVHVVIRVRWIGKIYHKIVEKTQRKIRKYVDKYGEIGVAIFIGIPLPGSGVYSGALGAYLLGLKPKKFIIANIIGVLIAGVIVTSIVLLGNGASSLFFSLFFK